VENLTKVVKQRNCGWEGGELFLEGLEGRGCGVDNFFYFEGLRGVGEFVFGIFKVHSTPPPLPLVDTLWTLPKPPLIAPLLGSKILNNPSNNSLLYNRTHPPLLEWLRLFAFAPNETQAPYSKY